MLEKTLDEKRILTRYRLIMFAAGVLYLIGFVCFSIWSGFEHYGYKRDNVIYLEELADSISRSRRCLSVEMEMSHGISTSYQQWADACLQNKELAEKKLRLQKEFDSFPISKKISIGASVVQEHKTIFILLSLPAFLFFCLSYTLFPARQIVNLVKRRRAKALQVENDNLHDWLSYSADIAKKIGESTVSQFFDSDWKNDVIKATAMQKIFREGFEKGIPANWISNLIIFRYKNNNSGALIDDSITLINSDAGKTKEILSIFARSDP